MEDVQRKQLSPDGVKKLILGMAEREGRNIPISIPQDGGQAGKDQVEAFARLLVGFDARFSTETGSKEARAFDVSAQCEAGNIKLVRSAWNKAFVDEFSGFPRGAHDDHGRCYESRAFNFILERRHRNAEMAMAAPTFLESGGDW